MARYPDINDSRVSASTQSTASPQVSANKAPGSGHAEIKLTTLKPSGQIVVGPGFAATSDDNPQAQLSFVPNAFQPPAAGGIESHVRTLARAQAGLGLAVRVYCIRHEPGPTSVESDGPVEVSQTV